MIKEYYIFIKEYLKLAQIKKSYLIITFVTAILFKLFELLVPLGASLIVKYLTLGDLNMTYVSLAFLVTSYILYDISLFFNCHIYTYTITYCYTRLQSRLLNKLITVDDSFTKQISKGKLLNSINIDVLDIGDMLDQISELITIAGQFIVLCIIVANYNLIIAGLLLLYGYIYIKFRNKADRKFAIYYNKQKNNMDQYTSLFSQILSGIQEIKTFNMIEKLKNKLNALKNKFSKNYFKKRKYYVRRDNDVRYISHFFRIVIYIILVIMIMNKKTTLDVLILIVGYHEALIGILDSFIETTATIREVSISVQRVNSILNYKPSEIILYGTCDNDYINGIVEFQNVNFSYNDKKIIKNLNLKIKPNSITAIVGQSGTGKTSIINLLLRLYNVDSGKILIDGVNIYDYTKDIYFSNVSVVNQKPFIFNMSIRKNLDFVDTNIEHQIEACKRVGIHDFIVSLPNGYNTVLKENATNISGGQKQLISLARTLLSKSEILLFDEITSSLDPETAKHISELLKDLKKDHTIIMITHKPDLMKKADRIVVMHQGKIVGDGKHNDLIKDNEHYKWLQARKSASKLGVFN